MAGFLSTTNFARTARVVALLFFLLPWINVSCSTHGMDRLADIETTAAPHSDIQIATVSGMQLATGSISYAGSAPFSEAIHEVSDLFGRPNPAVGGAALLILLSLGASLFPRGAMRTIAGIATAALAAATLAYVVLIQIPEKADALFHRLGGHSMGVEIHLGVQIGFYLCLGALVAAVLLDLVAMKSDAPAAKPPPGG